MGAIDFWGNLLLGVGPGIAVFMVLIAPKSFLVLLTLFSTFIWLSVLLITSAIFRGFIPYATTAPNYVGVLLASVAMQEAARYGVWIMHKKLCDALERIGRVGPHRLTVLDRLYLALSWGYGHGACQATFFFLSLVPLTTGGATYYLPTCPQMSVFVAQALNCLAFSMLLPSLTVVALDGYARRHQLHMVAPPLLHTGASLLTLASFRQNGCVVSAPLLLALGLGSVAYAAWLSWQRACARQSSGNSPRLSDS